MDIDAMTGVPRPRKRWLVAAIAGVMPVAVIGGAAAWFILTYVAPPTVSIPEPTLLASYEPPASTPTPESASSIEPASPPISQPQSARSLPMISGFPSTSIWPNVSGAPSAAPAYAATASADPLFNPPGGTRDASEPIAGPIPLPPPRPRISTAAVRGNVPLPRPRPDTEQD